MVKEFLPLYYNDSEPEDIDTESLMERVTRIYQQLLMWKGSLPEELASSQDALPHIRNLQ
jgi:hypothetical protein